MSFSLLMTAIEVAKDSNASVGTRAEAAKDAAGDKVKETKNSVSCLVQRPWVMYEYNTNLAIDIRDSIPTPIVTLSSKAFKCRDALQVKSLYGNMT